MKEWFQGLAVDQADRARRRNPSLIAWLFVLGLFCAGVTQCAHAQDASALLVASERLEGWYRGTVILAVPFKGRHVGLVLNRPTDAHMADLFPEDEPSKAVTDRVYLGGPQDTSRVYALTLGEVAPHPSALPMGPGVWLLVERRAIDELMERSPNAARYFAGFVPWHPGQLEAEIEEGMFHRLPLDPEKLFRPDTSGLYEELVPKKGEHRL